MAKEKTESAAGTNKTIAEQRNTSPDNAFRQDWPKRHNEIAPFVTKKGKIRGGLSVADQAKAKEILSQYGFKV